MRLFGSIEPCIEARQAKGATYGQGKRRGPAEFGRIPQRPQEQDQRGRSAERNIIGERIELRAELALRTKETSNATVQMAKAKMAIFQKSALRLRAGSPRGLMICTTMASSSSTPMAFVTLFFPVCARVSTTATKTAAQFSRSCSNRHRTDIFPRQQTASTRR